MVYWLNGATSQCWILKWWGKVSSVARLVSFWVEWFCWCYVSRSFTLLPLRWIKRTRQILIKQILQRPHQITHQKILPEPLQHGGSYFSWLFRWGIYHMNHGVNQWCSIIYVFFFQGFASFLGDFQPNFMVILAINFPHFVRWFSQL